MPSFDPFRGRPWFNEPQRQAITAGLGFLFPPAALAYQGGRLINAGIKGIQQWSGNLPANQGLSGNDPDYGNPNYIGLGDPAGTPTAATPAPGPMTPQSYQAIAQRPPPGGVNTSLLSSNARNAMGLGTPGFFGGYKGSLDSGTQSWMNDINARTQK